MDFLKPPGAALRPKHGMKALASTNPIAAVELQLGRNPYVKNAPNLKDIVVGSGEEFVGKSDPQKRVELLWILF